MPKTNELAKKRLRKAYLAGEGTLKALAQKFGVSYATAKRFKEAESWEALKQSCTQTSEAVQDAIATSVSKIVINGDVVVENFDHITMLEISIQSLVNDLRSAPIRSREGAIAALVKALDAHRARKPTTMMELAEMAIALPGFDPAEFAKCLRQLESRRA